MRKQNEVEKQNTGEKPERCSLLSHFAENPLAETIYQNWYSPKTYSLKIILMKDQLAELTENCQIF